MAYCKCCEVFMPNLPEIHNNYCAGCQDPKEREKYNIKESAMEEEQS